MMPSSITHAYLAIDIFNNLDKKVKNIVNLEDYKTYSQGPDIFYFYHIVFPFTKKARTIQDLGRTIHHEKTNDFFLSLTKQVKSTKNINQFNYLVGLFTHYMADSTIHPYVEYKAELLNKKFLERKDNHFFLETYFDNYYISKHNLDYKKFKGYNFCFNAKKNLDVINLLNKSIENVFDIKNIGTYYYKSLQEMKLFFKVFRYDPYKIKRYIYNILNVITKRCFRDIRYLSYNFPLDKTIDYLNLNHVPWHYLDNKNITSNKSIIDLYDEVVNKTVIKINLLYDYIFNNKEVDLDLLFENLSYGTGLPLNK